MTLFDVNQFSEIKQEGWTFNTLRPPLKLKEILQDFKFQWKTYRKHNLTLYKCINFFLLRVLQRLAYNFGWIISKNKFKTNNSSLREV